MRELSQYEIENVSGGLRAVGYGVLSGFIVDALKWAGREIPAHYARSEVAFRDDPRGRGRALL